jgi:Tfp pilus assembly protein PilO
MSGLEIPVNAFWGLGGGAAVASAFWFWIQTKLKDLDKVAMLEAEVKDLKYAASQFKGTEMAVVRVEEQIKHLQDQMKELKELMLKALHNG